MRLFVEAVLDGAARDALATVSQQLRSNQLIQANAVRWVKPDALHLTLRFLGEVDESHLPQLMAMLQALAGSGPIELQLAELGTFGGRRPRVVWVGLRQDKGFGQLLSVRQRLDRGLEREGFPPDSGRFRPHLTLGRVRRRVSDEDAALVRQAVDATPAMNQSTSVQQVALVQSTLLPDGPRYHRHIVVGL